MLITCMLVSLPFTLNNTVAGNHTDAIDTTIEEIISTINESFIRNHIATIQNYGPHPTGSVACNAVQQYLVDTLESDGLEVQVHPWSRQLYAGNNIIATLPGTDSSLAPIGVSAHYDSAPGSPGADDDGSGVAAVLAAAHTLRSYPFNRTVIFLLFSGEEQGTLGSLAYAGDLYHSEETLAGIINLDGIGHTETGSGGKKVIVYEEPTVAWLADSMERIASLYYQDMHMEPKRLPNTGYSDHNSFLSYGIGAIQVEEYEYNDKFHTSNDTLDFVNITYVTNIARLTSGTLAYVASIDVPGPQVTITTPRRDMLYLFNVKIFPLNGGMVLALGPIDIIANTSIETVRVVFYLDGQEMMVDEEAPFAWTCRQPVWWDHTVVVEAQDDDGNSGIAHIDLGWSLY